MELSTIQRSLCTDISLRLYCIEFRNLLCHFIELPDTRPHLRETEYGQTSGLTGRLRLRQAEFVNTFE